MAHLILFALTAAVAAYWVVRISTPPPQPAPPPLVAEPPRQVDASLAARMFGKIQVAVVRASNILVAGVFVAGKDSSAVLRVDGKDPRAFVLGQEIASGTTLVDVRADAVTIERDGLRQTLSAPAGPAKTPGLNPGPVTGAQAYVRQGDTLSVNPAAAAGY